MDILKFKLQRFNELDGILSSENFQEIESCDEIDFEIELKNLDDK